MELRQIQCPQGFELSSVWYGEEGCPGSGCLVGRIFESIGVDGNPIYPSFVNHRGAKRLDGLTTEEMCTSKVADGQHLGGTIARDPLLSIADNCTHAGLDIIKRISDHFDRSASYEVTTHHTANSGEKFSVKFSCTAPYTNKQDDSLLERSCRFVSGVFFGGEVVPTNMSTGHWFTGITDDEVRVKADTYYDEMLEWQKGHLK